MARTPATTTAPEPSSAELGAHIDALIRQDREPKTGLLARQLALEASHVTRPMSPRGAGSSAGS